ncbi:myeloid leukemia factor 2-like [Oppia nitens]|uniref:myeloid leukemia factor 2-like n=1 Tax=Oppia nitens TaxID=1686743 RepID=UPI0023DA15A5|nr:myeloid leukemia factor 2-like [Oppia nitens]
MAFLAFNDMDDMFGRMDRMMASMMNNMNTMMPSPRDAFGGPSPFNMLMPAFGTPPALPMVGPMVDPMSQLMSRSASLFPSSSMSISHHMTPENSYSYSSSMVSMSTDFTGRPQVYESTHSSHSGPGGLRETRSTVRDSRSGLQKMSIGHHIADRGHVMERSRNHYTGEQEDNNEYINIEEEEADEFNSEFRQRMNVYGSGGHGGHHHSGGGRYLTSGSSSSAHRPHGRSDMLALTAPPPPAPQPSSSSAQPLSRESPDAAKHHHQRPDNGHHNNNNHHNRNNNSNKGQTSGSRANKMFHKKKHSDKNKTKKPYKKSPNN